MRTILILTVLALALVAVPIPAEAHEATCPFADWPCYLTCTRNHTRDPTDLPHRCTFVLP